MDISKLIVGFKGLIAFCLVAWRPKNNFRSEENYGKQDTIRNSLAERQWVQDNQVPVCPITPEELLAEMTERQATWDSKKEMVSKNPTDENAKAELAVFEKLYTEPTDPANAESERKLIEPKFSGNAGFRRSRAFYGAMVQRATKRSKPDDPEPDRSFHGLVPVRITEYATLADRIIDQQLENEMQGVGTVPMDDLDKLRITKSLFDTGCREKRVRELYPSSTAQKTFGICLTDEYWKNLKIYDRFFFPKEDSSFIPWGPVRAPDLIKINNRTEADRKRSENLPLRETERNLDPISEKEVDNYFRDKATAFRGGNMNTPKMMSKDDITGASKNHPLLFARPVADSILANSTSGTMQVLLEHKDPLNTVYEMVTKDGQATVVDQVIPALKAEPDLLSRVSRLIAAGKKGEISAALDLIENPKVVTAPPVVEEPKVSSPSPEKEKGNEGNKGRKQQVVSSGK